MLSLSLPPAAHPGRESQLDTLELKPTHSQNEEMLCLSGDETEMGILWWAMVLVLSSYSEKPRRCRGCRRKNAVERQENNLVPIKHPSPGHSSSSVTGYIRLSLPSTATNLVWLPSLANT